MCGGACVCWFSRTQKCVTLSTSEAEYVALGDAVKELLFLRQVWRFMLPGKGMPCFPIFEDNQGAVKLAQNPVSSNPTIGGEGMVEIYPPLHGGCNQKGPFGGWDRISR